MRGLSQYIRKHKTLNILQKLIREGKCPNCEMLMDSEYHDCEVSQREFKKYRQEQLTYTE